MSTLTVGAEDTQRNLLASIRSLSHDASMPKPPDLPELIAYARKTAQALAQPGAGGSTGLATSGLEFLRKYAGTDSSFYEGASTFAAGLVHLRSGSAHNGITGISRLLEGWADFAETGLATAPTFDLAARTEAANDLMEQAETLLADRNVHHAVPVMIAGAALEELLRGLCTTIAEEILSANITSYGVALQKAGVLDKTGAKELVSLADIRNTAAHGHFTKITDADARVFVSRVNLFLSKHSPV